MRKYKNIRLKKSPIVVERVGLINRIINETINESFDSILKTEYEIVNSGGIVIYRFKTNSNNYYDLEFIISVESSNNELTNGQTLGDYINESRIITTDIAFVPSEINMDDRDNHELYTKETNRGEQFELMGRISYLIKEYIKNNPKDYTYVVGKNTKETKLSMYLYMFNNIFSDEYIKLEGYNSGYDGGSFYFINKKIIKK